MNAKYLCYKLDNIRDCIMYVVCGILQSGKLVMLRFRELPNTEVFILHLEKFWKKILDSTAAAVKTKKYNLGRYYIEMYKLCETSC